jgi:hypothetical protein
LKCCDKVEKDSEIKPTMAAGIAARTGSRADPFKPTLLSADAPLTGHTPGSILGNIGVQKCEAFSLDIGYFPVGCGGLRFGCTPR